MNEALFARCPGLAGAGRKVLLVGAGSHRLAEALAGEVVRFDAADGRAPGAAPPATAGSLVRMPFGDAAFDDVVCLDALGWLVGPDRHARLLELARVAARRLILRAPAGRFAAVGDEACAEHLRRARRPVPRWLDEALALGIPAFGDMLETVAATGCTFAVHVDDTLLGHCAGLVPDDAPYMARLRAMRGKVLPDELPRLLADVDLPYAFLLVIDAASRRLPPVAARPVDRQGAPSNPATATAPSPRLAVFAVGHRTDRMPAIPGIRRILAGARGCAPVAEADILRDDAGLSISGRNPGWSEMTAIHWVWRNVTGLDAVGFCHYRRYFDFRPGAQDRPRETKLSTPSELLAAQRHFADPQAIGRRLRDGAIVVSRMAELQLPNAEYYMGYHLPGHYLAMVNALLARHPRLAPQLAAHARDTRLVAGNMFVMAWPDFDRLCRFWFDCLFALDDAWSTRPAGYQGRAVGFVAERLFDVYLRGLRDAGRTIVEVPFFELGDGVFPPAG